MSELIGASHIPTDMDRRAVGLQIVVGLNRTIAIDLDSNLLQPQPFGIGDTAGSNENLLKREIQLLLTSQSIPYPQSLLFPLSHKGNRLLVQL